ncbi:MAG: extensin family protein [Pseudomonadota bacterium]
MRRGPDAEDAEVSSRPSLRPRGLERGRLRGSVCGDPDLKGEFVGAVAGRLQGCGIEDAVRVTSVSGIALSTGSLMNCRTARALKAWTEDSAVPSLRRVGGGLRELRVAAHYSCRTINNQPGGRLSEHGKGSAIDISAFRLNDGTELTLLGDWNSQRGRAPMRAMFRGACGPFSTVIGPDGDRFHLDHFHFDTAQRRSGFRYCR